MSYLKFQGVEKGGLVFPIPRHSPQLAAENLEHNLAVIDAFSRLAREREVEPWQLALAWVLAQGVIPLFGTRRAARVRANVQATAASR